MRKVYVTTGACYVITKGLETQASRVVLRYTAVSSRPESCTCVQSRIVIVAWHEAYLKKNIPRV